MTKLHYLILRNPKRLALDEMSPDVLRVFATHGVGLSFRATANSRCHPWVNAGILRATSDPSYRSLVFSIYDRYRPKGLKASMDPDPPLVNRITGERIADR